ncbi:hypothetical protein EES39_27895 [Streptomyces sp. ADI92-24]|nr:hypothetical protein EES39_27895 [Streptomyces sp. ADI92-24]
MARLRQVAIARGASPVRSCEAPSAKVVSRTWCGASILRRSRTNRASWAAACSAVRLVTALTVVLPVLRSAHRRLIWRAGARAPGFDYALAVRSDHRLDTKGGGFTTTALAGCVPARSWMRMRTGHGLKGDRHYDWGSAAPSCRPTPGFDAAPIPLTEEVGAPQADGERSSWAPPVFAGAGTAVDGLFQAG